MKAQGLKASLQDQMQEAEHEAAQAAAAVRMAQQELSTAQQQVKELSEQQQALKGAEGRLSSEVVSVRNELSEVLAEVSAGRMSHEEAAEYIEQVGAAGTQSPMYKLAALVQGTMCAGIHACMSMCGF